MNFTFTCEQTYLDCGHGLKLMATHRVKAENVEKSKSSEKAPPHLYYLISYITNIGLLVEDMGKGS